MDILATLGLTIVDKAAERVVRDNTKLFWFPAEHCLCWIWGGWTWVSLASATGSIRHQRQHYCHL